MDFLMLSLWIGPYTRLKSRRETGESVSPSLKKGTKEMKTSTVLGYSAIVAVCLASSLVPLGAQEHYNKKDLEQKMREAKTPAQYSDLVSYLRKQEDALRGEAQSQKEIYQKWAQMGPSSKFPSRGDTARNLYMQYAAKADTMAQLANDYEARLHPPTPGEVAAKTPRPESTQLTPAEQMMLDKLDKLEKQVKELSKQ
jgi:hypothetical protein